MGRRTKKVQEFWMGLKNGRSRDDVIREVQQDVRQAYDDASPSEIRDADKRLAEKEEECRALFRSPEALHAARDKAVNRAEAAKKTGDPEEIKEAELALKEICDEEWRAYSRFQLTVLGAQRYALPTDHDIIPKELPEPVSTKARTGPSRGRHVNALVAWALLERKREDERWNFGWLNVEMKRYTGNDDSTKQLRNVLKKDYGLATRTVEEFHIALHKWVARNSEQEPGWEKKAREILKSKRLEWPG
ncbi:MAG: hypothetical protein KJO98_16605 [Rhodothermia bacterium]|nr:hypothetical protein [Rhodothermia bacterium]NNE33621.1 hypothetical protein [Rhodothermales bacterium]